MYRMIVCGLNGNSRVSGEIASASQQYIAIETKHCGLAMTTPPRGLVIARVAQRSSKINNSQQQPEANSSTPTSFNFSLSSFP